MSTEILQLTAKVETLTTKVDGMDRSISEIKEILARQEGKELPARVFSLEQKMIKVELYQAERAWIPEQVEKHTDDIEKINKFMYKLAGALAIANFVGIVAGKFILDAVFK